MAFRPLFFALGVNAQAYPELIRRILREGHRLGNHSFSHPDLGAVSEARFRLEMNSTQRIFEAISGAPCNLFRPPYNARSQPSAIEEARPLAWATRLGYTAVGELLDPQDWRSQDPSAIVAECLKEIHSQPGNCLLLHDGGGPRAATVAALDRLLPQLRREGYRFVTLDQLSPCPPTQEHWTPALLENVAWQVLGWGQRGLANILQLAIVAAALRLILLCWLAAKPGPRAHSPYHPRKVTALIAAYNEAEVIAATVASLLSSDFAEIRVIVVDDGSTDGTLTTLPTDPRLRCIRQANSGKAVALNRALREAGDSGHRGLPGC